MQTHNDITQPPTSRAAIKRSERNEAIATLKEHLKRETTVYTVLRRVSATGMSRLIDLYVIEGNQPMRLTWSAAKALDWTYDRKREALRVNGCGMDMGFHTVHSLARVVLDDGYALTQRWL